MNISGSRLIAACVLSSVLGGACTFAALHFALEARADDKKAEKVLKAQRFEIVDADDKTIGYLGASPDRGGEIGLLLYANGGLRSASLTRTELNISRGLDRISLGESDAKNGKEGKFMIEIGNGTDVWKQP